MTTSKTDAEIIDFPKETSKKASSTERIWGKAVYKHGYAGIPSILIQAAQRLGINPMQMNIIIQLLDYWFEPSRKPFPTKQDTGETVSASPKRRFRTTSARWRRLGSSRGRCGRRPQATGTATSTTWTA